MPSPRRSRLLVISLLVLMLVSVTGTSPSSVEAATPTIRLSATSGSVGANITVSYRKFTKNRALKITWDGKTIATATASAAGDGATPISVPNGVKGSHKVKVIMGNLSASATYTIRPKLRMSPSSVNVEQRVSISLQGYAANESVKVTIDGATSAAVTVSMSASGNGTARFILPPTTGGIHTLTAKGSAKSVDDLEFRVRPSIEVIPGSGKVGANIRVHLRGFERGERIELQFRYPDQTSSLGFATASSTGSVNMTFTVPRKVSPGTYAVIGRGYGPSVAEVAFEVT